MPKRESEDIHGLELDGLSKSYGKQVALEGLGFTVGAGRMFGFVGPNGSGKTTAMRIALGLLEPDSGRVRWRGDAIGSEARRRIGYMPEERGLYPKMRVLDQLVYLAELHGLDADEAARKTMEWLERLGIAERSGDAVEQLSLGNQQRVQLAASLVFEPDLLILDEPFSGLDPTGVDVLSEVLLEVCRDRDVPVLFSSHQLELIERLCDDVAIIKDGRLIAAGEVENLRDSHSPDLWRTRFETDPPPTWLDGLDGVSPAGDQLYSVSGGQDPQALLDAARAHGRVLEFGRVRPTLAELFRETIADEAHADVERQA